MSGINWQAFLKARDTDLKRYGVAYFWFEANSFGIPTDVYHVEVDHIRPLRNGGYEILHDDGWLEVSEREVFMFKRSG